MFSARIKWLLRLLVVLSLPSLLVTCGSVLQGPVFGSISLAHPADAGDAVAFLRCRGPGIHGDIQTDAENTRVGPDGRFTFVGSLTFPTTERCYLDLRHPRYLTARAQLSDAPVQKVETVVMQSWDAFFAAGPSYELNPGSHRPWPASEVHRHFIDTRMWLDTFSARQQRRMARYIPDIHRIYTQAITALAGKNIDRRDMMRMISKLEEMTAYPYPYKDYVSAIEAGDTSRVQAFITGGVLRTGHSSMLYLAASRGHVPVIDVLLENDEPVNISGCNAPLLGAISNRQWPAALRLLRAGADIDTGCRTSHRRVGDVLGDFARHGQLDRLQDFLDAGVPVDLPNSHHTTALAEATTAGRIQAVKLLLAAGANPDQKTAKGIPLLVEAKNKGFLDIEKELKLAISGETSAQVIVPEGAQMIPLTRRLGETQPFKVHTSFGQIHSMVSDPQRPGVLWLATWGGLLRIVPETGEQRVWTMADGLPSGTVRNVWFEPTGTYLWLATNAGLARLPLQDLERVEHIGGNELPGGFASGFLPGVRPGSDWFWNSRGLYQLDVQNSEALHYALPQSPFGITNIPGSNDLFISDDTTLWRLTPASGKLIQVLDAEQLGELTTGGPTGLPQLRQLTIGPGSDHLWIGSHRHGVFRMDLESGTIEHPVLSDTQLAECSRSTVTPHIQGQVKIAAGQVFAQLQRCFGRIDKDNYFETLRSRIDAGAIADVNGDIWYVADKNFYRIDASGTKSVFPRQRDALDNAQVTGIDLAGNQLLVSAYRSPLAVLNLEKRTWASESSGAHPTTKASASSRSRSREVEDPDAPELAWGVHSTGVYLKNNGRVVHRWPARLPSGVIKVTRTQATTLWIASNSGLIEFPIAGSLDELRNPPEPPQTPPHSR